MSVQRQELHDLVDQLPELVDQLPEDEVPWVLERLRETLDSAKRRARAMALMEELQDQLSGITGVDEELDRLRDGGRG